MHPGSERAGAQVRAEQLVAPVVYMEAELRQALALQQARYMSQRTYQYFQALGIRLKAGPLAQYLKACPAVMARSPGPSGSAPGIRASRVVLLLQKLPPLVAD